MKRDTVGKISSELLQKEPESRDPVELQRAMQRDYIDHLLQCTETHKKVFNEDFYIVVETKQEKLMPNVFRNYFYARQSCPTPNYDQAVYRYNRHDDNIEFIWVIPDRGTAHHLKEHRHEIVKEEQWLRDLVLQFDDGSLFTLAKKLNKEEENSPLLQKGA